MNYADQDGALLKKFYQVSAREVSVFIVEGKKSIMSFVVKGL